MEEEFLVDLGEAAEDGLVGGEEFALLDEGADEEDRHFDSFGGVEAQEICSSDQFRSHRIGSSKAVPVYPARVNESRSSVRFACSPHKAFGIEVTEQNGTQFHQF